MAQLTDGTDSRLIFLFWGKPKVGKTVLASQFPNLTFVDLDDSLGSVRALRKNQGLDFNFTTFDLKESETTDEDFLKLCGKNFGRMGQWLKTAKLVSALSRTLTKDETLVVDNLSRIGESILKYIRTTAGRDQLQIQDWMTFTNQIQIFLESLKECHANVVLVGHEEYHKDEASGEIEKLILMPTKMRHRVPSVVTDYLYMKTDVKGPQNKREVVRKIQSMPDPMTAVGSRSLIPNIDNPTFEKLRPYIESALGRTLPPSTWTPKGA